MAFDSNRVTGERTIVAEAVVDAHVHLWDPERIPYPWLAEHPRLRRPFSVTDLDAAAEGVPLRGMVLVEGDCAPASAAEETRLLVEAAAAHPRIVAIVARADPTDRPGFERLLERYAACPAVRGIRQNIQGNAPGYCLSADFVAGVQEAGRQGLTFDLCVTHDQLPEVLTLVEQCPETSFVLDHCGKPDVEHGLLDPWREQVEALAALPHLRASRGSVVTLGSVAGFAPVVGRPAYVAAKHAVTGLMEALRPELAADGVHVGLVHPTFVTTRLATAEGSQQRSETGAQVTPEDVAAAVVDVLRRRRDRALVGRTAYLAWHASRLAPRTYTRLMTRRLRQESH